MTDETKTITDAVQRHLTGAFVSRVEKSSRGYEVSIMSMDEGSAAVGRIEAQVALAAEELKRANQLVGELKAVVDVWS